MTVFDALKGLTAFPVPESYIGEVATKRYLDIEEELTADILHSRKFLLAKADIYTWVFFAPNISQGGISFSLTDAQREHYRTMAEGIFAEYDEPLAGKVNYGYKGTKL